MRNIKVLFDNQVFVNQKFGGISRYYVELFKQFDLSNKVDWDINAFYSKNIYLNDSFNELVKFRVDNWNFKGSSRTINLLNKISYQFQNSFDLSDFNLCHLTYYDPFFLNKFAKKGFPIVTTVYDMIHEIFNGDPKTIERKREIINRSDLILAISESTSNDIQRFYNVPKDKIVITYLASSLKSDNNIYRHDLPAKYILYVGLRDWYKNFNGFIKAIKTLLISDKDLFVLCAGGPAFTNKELLLLAELGIDKKVVWYPIENDYQLATFYQQALFFVFPSKYEGFGIPILEAMNCDCPVALSNAGCLKEIANDAGLYFNPDSEESIRDTCRQLLTSSEQRENLIIKGRKRRKKFSWEKTAIDTVKAYESLLNAKNTFI